MMVLVAGATGATGRLLVKQLLSRGHAVKVLVRSLDKLPDEIKHHDRLSVARADILDLGEGELVRHVNGCSAVASCLGHNLTWRGIYGQPRMLVAEAVHRLCEAIKASRAERPTRFVLMNTAGNSNRDLNEPISFGEGALLRLIRLLLPPHVDNERAADHLRIRIGQAHEAVEWVVVRPDTLMDAEHVTDYEVHPSPTRSAIFNAGRTSRINVGDFMASLITDDDLWNRWRGQMPVIYNKAVSA